MVNQKSELRNLVGASEIAERLGVAHAETIHLWRRRYPEFPEPICALKMGLIWDWQAVEKWAKKTKRIV